MHAVQSRPTPAICSAVDVPFARARPPQRGPPTTTGRALARPTWAGICRLDRRDAKGDRSTLKVDQRRPQALGPNVQTKQDRRSTLR